MKKFNIKKITASIMAVASLAVGMTGMSASAANWTTRHVNGAPGSESYSTNCTISYSTNGANAYYDGVKHSVTGGSGKVKVNCKNTNTVSGTTKYFELTSPGGNPNKVLTTKLTGVINGITFNFAAYTTTQSNNMYANGSVSPKS